MVFLPSIPQRQSHTDLLSGADAYAFSLSLSKSVAFSLAYANWTGGGGACRGIDYVVYEYPCSNGCKKTKYLTMLLPAQVASIDTS